MNGTGRGKVLVCTHQPCPQIIAENRSTIYEYFKFKKATYIKIMSTSTIAVLLLVVKKLLAISPALQGFTLILNLTSFNVKKT